MADFNGDGRTEIAAIYKGYREDKNSSSQIANAPGSVYVKLFQWNSSKPGNDKLVESKTVATKNFTEIVAEGITREEINSIGDLKAVAADVDGDRKSELAMLGMHWKTTESSSSLAAFVVVTWGTWTAHLYLWKHLPTENTTPKFDSKAKTIGLAAGDFVGDGILLRNPYHFYFEGRNVFTSVIQALPYYVDYIPLPWEKDGKPKLANLIYVPGDEVTYVRTNETKDKNSVKTTSISTYEMKSIITGKVISWSPTDFIPFLPVPNAKISPKHSFLFDARLNYNGKDTAQKLEASTETVKTTETIKSTVVYSIMAYSVRHHFWRYPIEPVPAWYKTRSKDITNDGKFAYTVTMTEAPKSHKGHIGYNARHEEGNLFSYPTIIFIAANFIAVKFLSLHHSSNFDG